MISKDPKQRLFEVMNRVDSSFKPKLNENINEVPQGINPKYTHFAVLKDSNKIVNGWDYSEYEQSELSQFKKDYFFQDIIDMDIDPKKVAIYTTKTLQKKGINPFDSNNWYKSNTEGWQDKNELNETNDKFDINEILNSYLETALWAEEQDDDSNGLKDKSIYDIDEKSKQKAIEDINVFLKYAKEQASDELSNYDAKAIGHNLWLSRNGHGAGFFDDYNDKLQDIARNMKEKSIYAGDNGLVYIH